MSTPAPTPPPAPSAHSRERLSRAFFLAAFAGLALLLLRILAPFIATLGSALLLGVVLAPAHRRVLLLVRGRANVAAALSTLLVFIAVVLPLGAGAWFLVLKLVDFMPDVQAWVQGVVDYEGGKLSLNLPAQLQEVADQALLLLQGWNVDPGDLAKRAAAALGPQAAAFGAAALKAVPSALFSILVLLFATFFVFRDGTKMYHALLDVLPLERRQAEDIFRRLDDTLVAIVRGALITALVQGIVAMIGFFIAGAPFALLLGCAATLLAFIPIVGTMLVWLPTGIFLIATGHVLGGVFLLAWGAFVVGLVDNFVRPKLVGDRAGLPIFALFFCTLGGLAVFGPAGALIGPMALTAFLAFAAIFIEQWRQLPPEPPPPPAKPPEPEPPPAPAQSVQDNE